MYLYEAFNSLQTPDLNKEVFLSPKTFKFLMAYINLTKETVTFLQSGETRTPTILLIK